MVHRDVTFILVPRFSMIALFSALEPLRVANRFLGPVFRWRFLSADGEPVIASNAIPVSVSGAVGMTDRTDLAIVCASYDHEVGLTREMINEIRRLAHRGAALGGIDTGAFMLAEAGVLDGFRATCHWETLPAFRESYGRIDVSEDTYVIDRGRLTASGGPSALDMMLDWIAGLEGPALAGKIADTLVVTQRREHPGSSRIPPGRRHGADDPRLLASIRAMEAHIEDVIDIADVAALGGLSVRHLERLFIKELGVGPKAFYLQLRLERAQQLLTYGRMSVRDVSLATGFSSLAHFSRSYRNRFGLAPSLQRRRQAG